jgi:hypothetical protein
MDSQLPLIPRLKMGNFLVKKNGIFPVKGGISKEYKYELLWL